VQSLEQDKYNAGGSTKRPRRSNGSYQQHTGTFTQNASAVLLRHPLPRPLVGTQLASNCNAGSWPLLCVPCLLAVDHPDGWLACMPGEHPAHPAVNIFLSVRIVDGCQDDADALASQDSQHD